MMSAHALARVRRQSRRRIRLLLAQRRALAAHHPPDPAPVTSDE